VMMNADAPKNAISRMVVATDRVLWSIGIHHHRLCLSVRLCSTPGEIWICTCSRDGGTDQHGNPNTLGRRRRDDTCDRIGHPLNCTVDVTFLLRPLDCSDSLCGTPAGYTLTMNWTGSDG